MGRGGRVRVVDPVESAAWRDVLAGRFSSVEEALAHRIAESIRRRGVVDGRRVGSVVVLAGRGVVAGWNVWYRVVRGSVSVSLEYPRDYLTVLRAYAPPGSVAVLVGDGGGSGVSVVVVYGPRGGAG